MYIVEQIYIYVVIPLALVFVTVWSFRKFCYDGVVKDFRNRGWGWWILGSAIGVVAVVFMMWFSVGVGLLIVFGVIHGHKGDIAICAGLIAATLIHSFLERCWPKFYNKFIDSEIVGHYLLAMWGVASFLIWLLLTMD
jgi:hypothetical protein